MLSWRKRPLQHPPPGGGVGFIAWFDRERAGPIESALSFTFSVAVGESRGQTNHHFLRPPPQLVARGHFDLCVRDGTKNPLLVPPTDHMVRMDVCFDGVLADHNKQ
jgi:hypothetical protein